MGSDEHGESGSWPSDESEHRDESMEGIAVEEVMDIQLSVGVRSEAEMTLEGEMISGEDNDEETETGEEYWLMCCIATDRQQTDNRQMDTDRKMDGPVVLYCTYVVCSVFQHVEDQEETETVESVEQPTKPRNDA